MRNGQARGLQRYKCRDCGKTFNALIGIPLARLHYRDKWLEQSQAQFVGLGISKQLSSWRSHAAQRFAGATAFWHCLRQSRRLH